MPDTTVYLKDYQPPVFAVESINLDFDLHDEHVTVINEMRVARQHPGALILNGDELELVRIAMDGRELNEADYTLQDGNLIINKPADNAMLSITTRIYPQNNSKLSGLFRSNALFCTQCEAQGFRRISFFPDRPDVLTVYTTRISADKSKYPVLLSNGNCVNQGELPDGRHWVVWEDPFKKPSYLFALVAGNLVSVVDKFITCSGKRVDLQIYVEPGNEDKCAHAMASLKKAMRWDEEQYGREYDLNIFMIVAVSDFNMGAMENKGLNIFNSKYILARPDTATDRDFANIESVVAHEYFHNWTGNRITCRDWFQLSLKEGLTVFREQEFARDMNSRDVNRILDVKTLRTSQFPEDAGSMAHPVRPESYQEINNFYTATIYEKGAEVIRMQQTILGNHGFRRGMDLYFKQHDGQAVTIDDFVSAMEEANQTDLTDFKRWYSQAGTPTVSAKTAFENSELVLTLTQSCPPTPECKQKQPFVIPIRLAIFDERGAIVPLRRDVITLDQFEQTFQFPNVPPGARISLLRDFSAPIILDYPMSEADKLALLHDENNGFVKWDIAQSLAIERIHQALINPDNPLQISEEVMSVYRAMLQDPGLVMALRAELLTPPAFEDVIAEFTTVDPIAIETARDAYARILGAGLYDLLSKFYQELWAKEKHDMNGEAYGRRQLRNQCLALLMKANEAETLSQCQQQFEQARTMTDQLSALSLLNNCSDSLVRQQALDRFYQQWSKDELVMDKWFTIQATGDSPETLSRVKTLMEHPLFSLKNPNKVRALIGAFCMANYRNFHAPDGSGYAFLGSMLLKLDKINPQITARLATPFTRWQHYDPVRQALINEQLTQLQSVELSRDLREVVEKSLANALSA